MALGTIPPWLDINPSQFLSAADAGAKIGLGIASLRQQAADAAADRAVRSDAINRQSALDSMLGRERLANDLRIASMRTREDESDRLSREAQVLAMLGLNAEKAQEMAMWHEAQRNLRERSIGSRDEFNKLLANIYQSRIDSGLRRAAADRSARQRIAMATRNETVNRDPFGNVINTVRTTTQQPITYDPSTGDMFVPPGVLEESSEGITGEDY